MSDIDPRLRTTLGQRAEQVDVTGDLAPRAIALESRAHRRRVATAALGSALALVVAAPVVYSSLRPGQTPVLPAASTMAQAPTSSTPPATATSEPTPAETTKPTPRGTIDLKAKPLATALPRLGPATGTPDVPYAVDGVLHDGDTQVPLPLKSGIWVLARLDHGGALVRGSHVGDDSPLTVVDGQGNSVARLPGASDVAVSADRSHFLASDTAGELTYYTSRGAKVRTKVDPECSPSPSIPCSGYTPIGLVGDVAYVRDGSGGSFAWNTATDTTTAIKGVLLDVSATTGLGLVSNQQNMHDPGNVCSSLVDLETLEARWTACGGLAMSAFSPRAGYIMATRTMDGAGPMSVVVVRTEDARIALEVSTRTGLGAWSVRMNDAETAVTFSASEGTGPQGPVRNALVRCELTGACTVVGDPRTMEPGVDVPDLVWTVAQN